MKSYLLSCLVALFTISSLSAQNCEPDMLYADSTVGVYPATITESACINQPYSFDLTFNIPETVEFNGSVLTIVQIKLDSVSGLPEGMAYATNPATGIFLPADGLACANIYGTATSANTPGDYELILNGFITVEVFGPIALATLFQAIGVENYVLTLDEENSGTCLVNTEEPLNEQVHIETSPNPFSTETTINIYSEKVSENLTLEVYTMLGDRVHSEEINLSYGTNAISFDGSHLAEGVYFFNFSDGNNMLTQKMIVQR